MNGVNVKNINIYLIRHGRQESSLCNVNAPLSKEGKKQSQLCGKRLKNFNIDRLYSSKLVRAMQTAEIINRYIKVPYEAYKELDEIDFGELTGLTDQEIKNRFSDFSEERKKRTSDLRFPKGENGEDVYKRVYPVLMKIISDAERNQDANIAIVTHGGVIRSIMAGILGTGFEKKLVFAKDLENTSITKLSFLLEDKMFYIETLNDYCHIEKKQELLRKSFKRSI